jgi:hypothetical protein
VKLRGGFTNIYWVAGGKSTVIEIPLTLPVQVDDPAAKEMEVDIFCLSGHVRVQVLLCSSSSNLHLLDIITHFRIDQQVVRIDAGVGGLVWHRHPDRLLSGTDALLLHVKRLSQLPAVSTSALSTTTLRACTCSVTCQAPDLVCTDMACPVSCSQ